MGRNEGDLHEAHGGRYRQKVDSGLDRRHPCLDLPVAHAFEIPPRLRDMSGPHRREEVLDVHADDDLPADMRRGVILDRAANDFRFIPGPIFSNILLVDELNRAMPRTQSALLEAMEERCVTVEGVTHPLPDPFMVIATQNPGEQVGTFPLPESQLDRFLIATGIGYPSAAIEQQIISGGSIRDDLRRIEPLISHEELLATRIIVQKEVHLSGAIIDYIHRIVVATRNAAMVSAGISPRGAIALAQSSRARAWLDCRDHVIPEDIKAMLLPVGAHRLVLRPEHEGINKREVLSSLVRTLPVPR